MSPTRPRMVDTLDLARVEAKLDHLVDMMISIQAELIVLRSNLRLRDTSTDHVAATLRRTMNALRRLMRSVHGDGRSEW